MSIFAIYLDALFVAIGALTVLLFVEFLLARATAFCLAAGA